MKSPAAIDLDSLTADKFTLDDLRAEALPDEADAVPDPLADVETTGDDEVDTAAEYSALLEGFKSRARGEEERKRLVTDSEYWVAICFETREQKEAFLAALDLLRHGDKYMDGYRVAEKFGVALPPADVPYNAGKKPDKKLAGLVLGAQG